MLCYKINVTLIIKCYIRTFQLGCKDHFFLQTLLSSPVPGKCCGEFHIFVSIYFVGLLSMCFGSHGIFLIFYAFIGLRVRV